MQVPSRVCRWCTPRGRGSGGARLPWPCQGSARLSMGALLPKSSRNLPVSRVSERPPRSKMRGEPVWGDRLARTAENSGPDPKPIKINGRAPMSCRDTWHCAPPDTAHLRLSPGKRHVPMQRVSLRVGDMKAHGRSSQVCPLGGSSPWCQPVHCARTLGAWGPSSGHRYGAVPSCPHLNLQHLLPSALQWPGRAWHRLVPDLNRVAGEGTPQPTPLPANLFLCGKWHLQGWHGQDMLGT